LVREVKISHNHKGARMIYLLLKKSQLSLFDMPVQVAASVRKDGTVVAPHIRIQKVRLKTAPSKKRDNQTQDMFSPEFLEVLNRHGGVDAVKEMVQTAHPHDANRMLDMIAHVSGQPLDDVARELKGEEPPPGQPEIIEHVTAKGKVLRGIVRTDITMAQAKEIDLYTFRKNGGKLVAIAGEGVFFGSDKKAVAFREWLESHGADVEKLPEKTFMDKDLLAQTSVNARMIVLEKPAAAGSAPSDSSDSANQPNAKAMELARKIVGKRFFVDHKDINELIRQARIEGVPHEDTYFGEDRSRQKNVIDEVADQNLREAPRQAIERKIASIKGVVADSLASSVAGFDPSRLGGSGAAGRARDRARSSERRQIIAGTAYRLQAELDRRDGLVAAAEAGPVEGERNAEGLVFRGGRWHREDEPNATANPQHTSDDQEKPDGVYSTLDDFIRDTEPFSDLAFLAVRMAGFKKNWQTHGKTLGEVVSALRPVTDRQWELEHEISDPAFSRAHRNSFHDAWLAIGDIEKLDKKYPKLHILKKIKGVWALDLVTLVHKAGGRYDVPEEKLRWLIKLSKGYGEIKNAKQGKISDEDQPKNGDRNAEGLIFRDGRWHREEQPTQAAPAPDPETEAAEDRQDLAEELARDPHSEKAKVLLRQVAQRQVEAEEPAAPPEEPENLRRLRDKVEELGGKDAARQLLIKDKKRSDQLIDQLATSLKMDRADVLAEFGLSEGKPRTKRQSVASPAPAVTDDADDPSSPAYRYADTGYIAGSRKDQASQIIRRAKVDGAQVLITSIDWGELEENPREAKELITKSNLFGLVNWDALKAGGMEPGAGFLVDRVYAAIGTEPSEDSAQARRDYTLGLQTLRTRLEACKTAGDVADVLDNLREEYDGRMLNAEESVNYQKLAETARDAYKHRTEIRNEQNRLYKLSSVASNELYTAQREVEKREKRGWKIPPELAASLPSLKAAADAAENEWRVSVTGESKAKVEALEQISRDVHAAQQAITLKALTRNKLESPLHRAWNIMGDRFIKVLRFRSHDGSDAFATHVAAAKIGSVKDWSWQEKEVTRAPRITKESARFQMRVADRYERVGGRTMTPDSTMALKKMFGLRDVQSGNWVLRDVASAKFHTEQCAASFADLADLLGARDEEISMNGRLAMAFGARGHGAAGAPHGTPVRAHYDPTHRIINLTKMGGGGSLAHEWWHALDNMIKEAEGGGAAGVGDFASESPASLPEGELRDAFNGLRAAMLEGEHQATRTLEYTAKDFKLAQYNLRSPNIVGKKIINAGSVGAAIDGVQKYFESRSGGELSRKDINMMKQWHKIAIAHYGGNPSGGTLEAKSGHKMSSFALEALKLDQGGREYYSQHLEMSARAFQSWVEDSLRKKGQKNDYLSALADNKYHRDFITGIEWKPFPEGEERQRINAAFDNLVSVLKKRGTLAKALAMM
jgi:Large polyvalent protein-associated domain 1